MYFIFYFLMMQYLVALEIGVRGGAGRDVREVCVFLIPVKKCARIDYRDLFEY